MNSVIVLVLVLGILGGSFYVAINYNEIFNPLQPDPLQPDEVLFHGTVMNKNLPGLPGVEWWDVNVEKIDSDNDGHLTLGVTIRVRLGIYPPMGYRDEILVDDYVNVYGKYDSLYESISINGLNYYIYAHIPPPHPL